jgi:pyridoxine kinase
MPLVLVISSYVAGSRVGGGIAPFVLGPMKVDPIHIPTCLFGRHPGWGPPGGAAVEADTMAKMLVGIEANGLLPKIDAVVAGHFSKPDQVAVACEVIERIRAAERAGPPATIIIDPVMGDEGPGLYIKEPVAEAIIADLIPRADIVAPNLWEFAKILGTELDNPPAELVARGAHALGGRWLISSVPSPAGVGVAYVDDEGALFAETPRIEGKIPNGAGDMLTLRFAGALVSGLNVEDALADAVGATYAVIEKSMEWNALELALVGCSDILASPPRAPIRLLP